MDADGGTLILGHVFVFMMIVLIVWSAACMLMLIGVLWWMADRPLSIKINRLPPDHPNCRCGVRLVDEPVLRPEQRPLIVPVEIHCPSCGRKHVDAGAWVERPHRTHLCEYCSHEWRPFEFFTVGVETNKQI